MIYSSQVALEGKPFRGKTLSVIPQTFRISLLRDFIILDKLYEWVITPLNRLLRVSQFVCSIGSEQILVNESVD